MPVLISRTIKSIGPLIRLDFSSRRKQGFGFFNEILIGISIGWTLHDLSIIDRQVSRLEIFEILLGSLCGRERISFGLEPAGSRDANDIAVLIFAQTIGVDDQIHRLVPRHFDQPYRNLAIDVVGNQDVLAADFTEEPEDVLDVGVLEFEGNLLSGIFLFVANSLVSTGGFARRFGGILAADIGANAAANHSHIFFGAGA